MTERLGLGRGRRGDPSLSSQQLAANILLCRVKMLDPPGKLPGGTGWQPVLPRILRMCAMKKSVFNLCESVAEKFV